MLIFSSMALTLTAQVQEVLTRVWRQRQKDACRSVGCALVWTGERKGAAPGKGKEGEDEREEHHGFILCLWDQNKLWELTNFVCWWRCSFSVISVLGSIIYAESFLWHLGCLLSCAVMRVLGSLISSSSLNEVRYLVRKEFYVLVDKYSPIFTVDCNLELIHPLLDLGLGFIYWKFPRQFPCWNFVLQCGWECWFSLREVADRA